MGQLGFLISMFPSTSWPLWQHGVEHYHAAESLYHVFRCIAAACFLMIGLYAFHNNRLGYPHDFLRLRLSQSTYFLKPVTPRFFANSGLTVSIWRLFCIYFGHWLKPSIGKGCKQSSIPFITFTYILILISVFRCFSNNFKERS